jgi:hypothetical protein
MLIITTIYIAETEDPTQSDARLARSRRVKGSDTPMGEHLRGQEPRTAD